MVMDFSVPLPPSKLKIRRPTKGRSAGVAAATGPANAGGGADAAGRASTACGGAAAVGTLLVSVCRLLMNTVIATTISQANATRRRFREYPLRKVNNGVTKGNSTSKA